MIDLIKITPFEYEYTFKWALILFLLIPLVFYFILQHEKKGRLFINLSSINGIAADGFSFIKLLRFISMFLVLLALSFVILALARPYLPEEVEAYKKKNIEGIDIVISMDVSGSMLAKDFTPNRLEVAKEVAMDFIKERPSDRIGLVVYEGEAYTQVPLTNDHELLLALFEEVETGMVTPGTAIGTGLAVAINRLIESDAKSKVVILLTDGMNNSGDIVPLDAAAIAKQYGICVYTIGIGSMGTAQVPVSSFFGEIIYQEQPVMIDEELLTNIAVNTGGKYFRATDEERLKEIYAEIDELEKSKVKVLEYKLNPPEQYYGFLFWAIIMFVLNRILSLTVLRSVTE